MKVTRGNYEGASKFAEFDRDLKSLSLEECRGLLEHILHRAMPGEVHSEVVYRELGIAEECWKEHGSVSPRKQRGHKV